MKQKYFPTWLLVLSVLVMTFITACGDGTTGPDTEAPAYTTKSTAAADSVGDTKTQECYGSEAEGYTCDGIVGGGGDCNRADAFHSCYEQGGGSYTGGDGSGGSTGGGDAGGSTGPGDGGTSADIGTVDGTGDCPTCDLHNDTTHLPKYQAALQKIDQNKCPELYAKAVEYASTFEIWTETRTDPETKETILGEWLDYGSLLGTPTKPTTAGFWETHLLYGTQFPLTVAHEAAHGIGKSDDGKEAEVYAQGCMK